MTTAAPLLNGRGVGAPCPRRWDPSLPVARRGPDRPRTTRSVHRVRIPRGCNSESDIQRHVRTDIERHIQACRRPKARLVFLDAAAAEGHRGHAFEVSPSTPLKTLFVEYAERRGVSLRLLRFSFAGRTLFPSQVGRKALGELGMRDRDVIEVAYQPPEEETRVDACRKHDKPISSRAKPKRHRKSSKKKRAKGLGKENTTKRDETLEELKILHSKALTQVHEELQPWLKQTRQRLNALLLERTRPKDRSSVPRRAPSSPPPYHADVPRANSPGRAGKSSFVVRVGAVENLYKTRKASCGVGNAPEAGDAPELDLHGYTREEALARLDEALEAWTDAAMRGSYPFVITARIVCGCGAQILREAVEGWIKSKRNVSNVPKKG